MRTLLIRSTSLDTLVSLHPSRSLLWLFQEVDLARRPRPSFSSSFLHQTSRVSRKPLTIGPTLQPLRLMLVRRSSPGLEARDSEEGSSRLLPSLPSFRSSITLSSRVPSFLPLTSQWSDERTLLVRVIRTATSSFFSELSFPSSSNLGI